MSENKSPFHIHILPLCMVVNGHRKGSCDPLSLEELDQIAQLLQLKLKFWQEDLFMNALPEQAVYDAGVKLMAWAALGIAKTCLTEADYKSKTYTYAELGEASRQYI